VRRRPKAVLAVIALVAAARMARDRRTHEQVILVALVVAAAIGLGRAGEVGLTARLIAWDKKRSEAEQRRVKARRS
jgi:hypothetical protein